MSPGILGGSSRIQSWNVWILLTFSSHPSYAEIKLKAGDLVGRYLRQRRTSMLVDNVKGVLRCGEAILKIEQYFILFVLPFEF